MKAIETIFPKTANLLCRFHINKNVKSRCKEHVVDDMRETVEKMWFELIKASDEMEYHQRLKQLEDACVDSKGFIDYVNDTWLTPHRHRFVEAWINQVLHLGNTTTNRVESAHWKLKQMLENSLGHLSLSYFPMTSAHSPNASIYCIGFVNGNHWVQVNMNEGFPLPPVTTDWTKYRTKDATSWMVGFAGRLQHWQRLMPILPKHVSLD
ncbi:uncharacterized protein LOC131644786 [Vicia villosa]|uniref:uncharacterized protein LOC131644786 n=1 Tax=Vicia villosa TaxID=3911 RepID=UPI00273B715B|nr:uncharacterized protein LOC131644786 [Vicia villosa]